MRISTRFEFIASITFCFKRQVIYVQLGVYVVGFVLPANGGINIMVTIGANGVKIDGYLNLSCGEKVKM